MPRRPSRRRLFFAIWPDEGCRAQLEAALQSAVWIGASRQGRAVPPPDWHVTLCFLGGVEEALLVALCERAGSVTARAFELQFRCLRHWGQAGVIAALAPAPAPAATLAEALRVRSRELGLTPDEQPLQPHITLVRGLRGKPWQGPRETALELTLAARSFRLVESLEGVQAPAARYRTLEEWPLEC